MVQSDKNTDRARFLLTAAKLPFTDIDVGRHTCMRTRNRCRLVSARCRIGVVIRSLTWSSFSCLSPLAVQISLAENTAAKEYMHAHSGAENKNVLPQVFQDGVYKGVRTHTAGTPIARGTVGRAAQPGLGCELDPRLPLLGSALLCLFSAPQTTDILDEWNEYGELKVNLGAQ